MGFDWPNVDRYGAAVHAPQGSVLLQLVEVAANRGHRDPEFGAQLLHAHRSTGLHDLAQALSSFRCEGDDVVGMSIRNAHE